MLSWRDVLAQEERSKDLMREAEIDRLTHQSKPQRSWLAGFLSEILAWAAGWLAARRIARHEDRVDAPRTVPAKRGEPCADCP